MKRAYSVQELAKMRTTSSVSLGEELDDAMGEVELSGTWFVYGPPKNGKTSMAMTLAKALAEHKKVLYNSVEEGIRKTVRMAVERQNMHEVGRNFFLLDREFYDDLYFRLSHNRKYGVIFIDSVQFMGLSYAEYKKMKLAFPDKLFVFVSHVKGNVPDGKAALRIMQDSDVIFSVRGFKAFVTSRFGGNGEYLISEEMAEKFYVK